MMFLPETISVKCFYVCIIHRRIIVIGSETNEKMDPKDPPSINSHCIFFLFNSDHTALFSVSNFCHVIGLELIFLEHAS